MAERPIAFLGRDADGDVRTRSRRQIGMRARLIEPLYFRIRNPASASDELVDAIIDRRFLEIFACKSFQNAALVIARKNCRFWSCRGSLHLIFKNM